MNIVVRCGCGGVQTYVESSIKALKLAAPDNTFVGKEKIRTFASQYPGTNLSQHLDVVAKKSGRYAFYISTTGEPKHDITAMYNLITGKKVY